MAKTYPRFLIISNSQVIMAHDDFTDAARDADSRATVAPIGNAGSRFWVVEVRAFYEPVKRVNRRFVSIGSGRDTFADWLQGLCGEVRDRARRVLEHIRRRPA